MPATTWSANVQLAWDANPETDLQTYRLYRGTVSGQYDAGTNVGLQTLTNVGGLSEGQTYYFAVSAVNQAGLESDRSNEVSYQVPSNLPPVYEGGLRIGTEDHPLNFILDAYDPEGQPLVIYTNSIPQMGTVVGAGTNWTFTPLANWYGTDAVAFSISDGVNTIPVVVELSVIPQNDDPVCIPPTEVAGDEDTAFTAILGAHDVDGDDLVFRIDSQPANAIVSLSGGSVANITPQPNFYGSDSFTFSVTDGTVTRSAVVPFTVRSVNDRPTAKPGSVTVVEGESVNITLVASDVENDPLTFAFATNPTRGTLSGTPPNVVYTSTVGSSGIDTFQFTANDGSLTSSPETITITVTPKNSKPVASPQSIVLAEDSSIAIHLVASDPEGSPVTYTVGTPLHGVLTGTAPNLTYKPVANYNGTDAFTFKASDGSLSSDLATVSITVTSVNDAPVAVSATVALSEDTSAPFVLMASDVDNPTLSYTITKKPTKGTLSGVAPSMVFTPNTDYNGTDSLQFTVNDGTLTSTNTATITFKIAAVNDKPKANPRSIALYEDATFPFTLTGSDPEKDALYYQIKTQPQKGRIIGTPPNIRYIPNTNFCGSDCFEFTVADRSTTSDPAVVSITVGPVNDAPCAGNASVTTTKATPIALPISCMDADGDALSMTITKQPAGGTLTGTAPNLVYTPSATYLGTDAVEYKVSDGKLTSTAGRITISVVESTTTSDSEKPEGLLAGQSDEALVTYGATVNVLTSGAASVLANDTSADGSSLTATLGRSPANGTVEIQPDGTFAYTHLGGSSLGDEFTYLATTAAGETTENRVVIHVVRILDGVVTDTGTEIEVSVANGITYQLEVQDVIPGAPSTWQNLTMFAGETDGIATVTDTAPVESTDRLYRVRCVGAFGELTTETWLRPAMDTAE